MKFRKASLYFDQACEMSECLDSLLEGDGDDRLECRRVLDSCIDRLKTLDPKLMLEIDDSIGALMNEYAGIYFTAGYVIGQAFDITDPEALEEINFLKEELKQIIPFWPRKKAPDNLRGTPGASSEQ